ncbi:uncharacterized protein DUF4259 [Litoreibacter ponti]|uniref:Uncharacterized protein DUF4259 n=1 Tax=Litoreibacter ponti TaxID=1510457 RepID=A0A2T6BKF1_9RHOB|nr:DUF4259 domain-containing protein [Litoreibacter ponti]PTX56550.1 uncharacterized protein DUF4259 [Litoreibacter ponti]
MGAWGSGIFDNDGAGDWLAAYEEEGASMIDSALSDVSEAVSEGYIEIDVANAGLAAAEGVATCFGAPSKRVDGDVRDNLIEHEDEVQAMDDIVARAITAVEAIIDDADKSEFTDLWQDAGAWDEVTPIIDDLLARLGRVK